MVETAERITRALNGSWYGRYGVARCPAHGDDKPSLSLAHGADGRLLLRCHAGCEFVSILDALRALGILEGRGAVPKLDQENITRRMMEERLAARKKACQARQCWVESLPINGTVAEAYLREVRGISCMLPETLRYHPSAWHGATGQRLPALVARIDHAANFAVHRTYLRADGSGKALVQPEKAMLGPSSGGGVRLANGHEAVAVAEGIETGLSLLCGPLQGSVAVWAALSASGMKALLLPTRPGSLIIATDSDDCGVGRQAGLALADRAHALGWAIRMLPAPEGADWNDVIRDMKGPTK
ncbi:toprim domain-containing protein [Sinirhodobacter sp. WL0062]|uniref:Toprim domain-containing protein n=1 Tax=Rhodobacter flavimaris TaxID=2907145 RepID=A0ABS8YVB9_9RHOB|nr:toprim domain-containing protein [Sinirhodobacter sp. WL0062]MCE5972438.1 toprim domain-containing protein [Sinirhodobacter sp. WL0062]